MTFNSIVTELHCVSKKRPTFDLLYSYNPDTHDPIMIIFLQKWSFIFQPYLSDASALSYEIENPENSALVHFACSTVQLLQRSRLWLSWTMPPRTPRWTHWLQELGSHTAASERVVSQKDWRNQEAGWIPAMHSIWVNNAIFVFPHLSKYRYCRSTSWGGICKASFDCLLYR